MNDRELYLRAIHALPEKWLNCNTRISVWQGDVCGFIFFDLVIAANPEFTPMEFRGIEWNDISIDCSITPSLRPEQETLCHTKE